MPTPIPLLADELTDIQKISLSNLRQHPGYLVLEEMFKAACNRAIEEVIKLDPTDERYEQKLKAFQLKARERNEFCSLVIRSIDWQARSVQADKNETEINPILKGLNNEHTIGNTAKPNVG